MTLFKNPHFVKSAVLSSEYPDLRDPGGKPMKEMAVVGRSNVGKSSLLNHLLQTPHLAKTSSTPGKTQLLNFFTASDHLSICDLPGYGYAKVPLQIRQEWGAMVQEYFESRHTLELLLLLIDIRRTPNEEDLRMFEWICSKRKKAILVLTKVDKVKEHEKNANTKIILQELNAITVPVVYYSAMKNVGRHELTRQIAESI